MTQDYELKLSDGKTAIWSGTTGENAAHNYADCHPDAIVIAWRYPKSDLHIGMVHIVEPGREPIRN